MTTELGMYWLPLVLAVGLAATVLGPRRGVPISLLGGIYWLMLVMIRPGGLTNLTLIDWLAACVGAGAIGAIGVWLSGPAVLRVRQAAAIDPPAAPPAPDPAAGLGQVIAQFQDWLDNHRDRPDPWPDFGEFIRTMLHASCGGQRIQVFAVPADARDQLHSLHQTEPGASEFPSARTGLVGHVVTSGRGFRADDPTAGDLLQQLLADEETPCAWCFPIRRHRQTVGVVRVGVLPATIPSGRPPLPAIERLVALCWQLVDATVCGREAAYTDPVTGVLTYAAFLHTGEQALAEAYAEGEPLALASIDVEGLRAIADNQRWDFVNEAVGQVSNLLREQTRADDRIGIFGGSTFVLLLRRVDSTLASLIVQQLLGKLSELGDDTTRWGGRLVPRCGMAGSGMDHPDLATLIRRATDNIRTARAQQTSLVSDLTTAEELAVK